MYKKVSKKIVPRCRRNCKCFENISRRYQILGRRTGRKQKGLQIETTPVSEGWKAFKLLCVVFFFNFSSRWNCESKLFEAV